MKYINLASDFLASLPIIILYIDIPININNIDHTIGNNIPGGESGGLIKGLYFALILIKNAGKDPIIKVINI